MDWLDDEFFKLGAFQARERDGAIVLAKGGSLSETLPNKLNSPSFFIKDFFDHHYFTYTPRETKIFSREELLALDTGKDFHFECVNSDDELYQSDFHRLSQSFNNELQKVVLISRESYQSSHDLKARRSLFFKSLRFGAGLPYGFWNQDYGIVGSTPELLYSLQGKKLTTFALAGTSRVGKEEEFLASTKDQHEHQLVVQDIKEKLRPYTTQLDIQKTGLVTFKDLIHLRTDMSATISDKVGLVDLVDALSPTAALGGYPQDKSLEFLQSTDYYKKYSSRFFGSAFGMITSEEVQVLVMIRNVQWQGSTFFIESGGGVVPESKLERELDEIHLKRSVIREHYL